MSINFLQNKEAGSPNGGAREGHEKKTKNELDFDFAKFDERRENRGKILKLIEEHEKVRGGGETPVKKKRKLSPFSFLKNMANKFKKLKKEEEVLIDYRKILDGEEKKQKITPLALLRRKEEEAPSIDLLKKEEYSSAPDEKKWWKKIFVKNAAPKRTEKTSAIDKDEIKKEKEKKKEEEEREEEKKQEGQNVLGTNLIKGEIVSFFDWKENIANLTMMVVLACFIVGGVYVGLNWWGEKKRRESRVFMEEVEEFARQITEEERGIGEIKKFQTGLKLVTAVLDNHIYWTNFFKFLEENTLADVYFTDFSGDKSGKYKLPARAKDFNAIAVQIETLKANSQVLSAKTGGGKIGAVPDKSGGKNASRVVEFELELSVNPEIFKK
jgi:hypothetical protein